MISLPLPRCHASGTRLLVSLTAAALLATPAAAQAVADSATWSYGAEVGRTPGALLRWEVARADWLFGVGTGVGPGDQHVRARATPAMRIGRALPSGFRVDGGLGVEWAWLDRASNTSEIEIQWELTGGWSWTLARAEAGVRWTDYRSPRREGVVRLSLAQAGPSASTRDAAVPEALDGLGIPPALTVEGRVHVEVDPPDHPGSGFLLAAANPHGDPAPGTVTAPGDNIDRLGTGLEAWSEHGPWSTWLRWRSDLHTDPSIRDRIAPIAEGLPFPVSISFSGGGSWRQPESGSIELGLRHDPRAFLWIPHLAAERTAAVSALEAEAVFRDVTLRVDAMRLDSVAGQSVEPLGHTHLHVAYGDGTVIGAEHQRLVLDDRLVTRSRGFVERDGRVFGRAAAGDGVSLIVGARTSFDGWRAEARAGFDSRPELLDYDALLARGWLREGNATDDLNQAGVINLTLSAGRGPFEVHAAEVRGDPIWTGDAVRAENGGRAYVMWSDTLASGRVEGQARIHLGRWGSRYGWWREEPAAEGLGRIHLIDGPLRLSAELAARTALVSARSGLEEPGGTEVGIALTGPMPALGPLGGMLGQARLEDVLDTGLPARVGAPERGRRLILIVTLASGGTR